MSAITCDNVGIQFAHGSQRAILRRALRRAVFGHSSKEPDGKPRPRQASSFWALRNLSFSLPSGSTLGVCGINGAGKTTLMRVISGIYAPDEGCATVTGRTSALLSLGVGISSSLSGRENLDVVGAVHGLRLQEVRERYEEIRDFADLDEDTMRTPVRYYSSGMRTRLGFAIYAVVTPEILLIDEVLAVGDASFREKSGIRLRELSKQAKCVVISSHNLGFLRENCDTGLWLHESKVAAIGPIDDVINAYTDYLRVRPR